MPFCKSPSMDRAEVERLAEGWGKVVARRVRVEVGPELAKFLGGLVHGVTRRERDSAAARRRGGRDEKLLGRAWEVPREQPPSGLRGTVREGAPQERRWGNRSYEVLVTVRERETISRLP